VATEPESEGTDLAGHGDAREGIQHMGTLARVLALLGATCLAEPIVGAQYTEPQGRFSLDTPQDWVVLTVADGSSVPILSDPAGKASLIVLVGETPGTQGLDALPGGYEGLLRASRADVSLTPTGDTRLQLAGQPALQRRYRVHGPTTTPRILWATFVQAGPLSLALVAGALEADFASFEQAFQQCVQSLLFSAAPQSSGVRPDAALRGRTQALVAAAQAGLLSESESARLTSQLAQQPPAQVATPPTRAGKTYHHPIGFTFWYPDGWTVVESNPLQLIPPDRGTGAQGPTEAYLIVGNAAPGIERADDPRVSQFIEGQLAALLPNARRVGTTEPISTTGGPGALTTWEGTSPTGLQVRACAYVTLLQGYGVGLLAIGERQRVESRQGALREVFGTFGLLESQRDPQVVGTWRNESRYNYRGPAAGVGDDFASTAISQWAYQADGTFRASGQVSTSANIDTGMQAGGGGRWATGEGHLYMVWADGSYSVFKYYVQGAPGSRAMLLTPPNGEKQLWEEVR